MSCSASIRVFSGPLAGARRVFGAGTLLLASAGAVAPPMGAQRAPAPVTVSGVAFDSLRGVPLPNAFVMLTERGRSTTSDDRGRFRFDSVPPGTYTFALQHAVFDTLGLPGATARVTVTDGRAPLVLAVPGFATLWRAACGTTAVPARDTGFLYGTVVGARDRKAIPQAWVELSWLDVVKLDPAKKSLNVTQRRWKNEVQADANGGFAICGTPTGHELSVRGYFGTNTTATVVLKPSVERVRRMDIVLSGTAAADAKLTGIVRGQVVDSSGRALRDVRVAVADQEARTDPEGRFYFRGVPAGTRQVDATAVGYNPTMGTVDVFANDTAQVTLTTYRVSALDTLRVRASAVGRQRILQFEERRRQGYGNYLDSTAISQRATVSAALQGLPGVQIQNASANGRRFNIFLYASGVGNGQANCLANILVDGVQQTDSEFLNTMAPADFAAIEVYQRRTTTPMELLRSNQSCGVVAFWTKRAWK